MGKGIFDRPIAHRGLHDRAAGVIENSRGAFELAIAADFAIECDLQLTRDGVPVVFHDDRLERLTGLTGYVRDVSSDVLLQTPLLDSAAGDCPQTFGQLLAQVAGRTLLQVELKHQISEKTRPLAAVAVDNASRYRGPLCFESFDPWLLRATRRAGFAGELGIITEAYVATGEDYAWLSGTDRIMLRHLLHWPLTRFDFISVDREALDVPAVRLFRALGKPVTSWTIRSPEEASAALRAADQIVFEGFVPQVPEETLRATVHASTASIAAATWNGLLPSTAGVVDNPFLEHAFFLALEESGCATRRTGWQPQYILLADQNDKAVGLLPLFLKSHSMGEYVFDHGWADAFERAGGSYYPKLQGSIPFTPVTAPKLLVPGGDPAVRRALLTTAETLCDRLEASSVHATFVPEDEGELAAGANWLVRIDTQFHWHNQGFASFEEFLGTLSSRHRKIIRRERRDALAGGLTVKALSGADLTEAVWDAFYEFYEDTGSRKWGRPYLNRKFFSLLGEKLASRVVLIMAYDGNDAIAGALNLAGTTTLFGRNWGTTRQVPFLHFEVCYYQAIDYAIEHKLKVVEAGAQGEHKLARGYEPTLTRSIHWISNTSLRKAIADYLVRERASVVHNQDVLDQYTPFRKGDVT